MFSGCLFFRLFPLSVLFQVELAQPASEAELPDQPAGKVEQQEVRRSKLGAPGEDWLLGAEEEGELNEEAKHDAWTGLFPEPQEDENPEKNVADDVMRASKESARKSSRGSVTGDAKDMKQRMLEMQKARQDGAAVRKSILARSVTDIVQPTPQPMPF